MNVFKFEFRRLLKSAIIWSVVCVGLVIMFMALFPSMKDSGMQDIVATKLDALPPALLEAFNLEEALDFSNISDYLAYAIQYISMAAGIYGIILGISALVKEESEGTIEFLYSKPITRSKIVTSKLLSSAIIFYLFIAIVGAVTMGVSMAVKPEEIEIMTLLMDIKTLFIGMAFLGYIFMALDFIISYNKIKQTRNIYCIRSILYHLYIWNHRKDERWIRRIPIFVTLRLCSSS